jgi:hypothetical protein
MAFSSDIGTFMKFAALAFLCACASPAAREPASMPQPDAVLGRFIGAWKTEARIVRFGPPLRETRALGRAASRATLEGMYVEFRTSSIEPPGTSELQIMSYDAAAGIYRQWVFDSDGYRHEALGRWNAATSTLRWEGEADGARLVIDDHWVSPDRLEWSLTRTGRDGHLFQRIDGVVSRE